MFLAESRKTNHLTIFTSRIHKAANHIQIQIDNLAGRIAMAAASSPYQSVLAEERREEFGRPIPFAKIYVQVEAGPINLQKKAWQLRGSDNACVI